MTRNAFALTRVAERIGLVSGAPRQLLFVSVFLLPVLAAVALLAALDHRRVAAGVAVVLCAAVGFAGAGVMLHGAGRLRLGPVLALPLASIAFASGASLVFRRSPT